MKTSKNHFVGFRTDDRKKLEAIAEKMNTTPSALMRQLVSIFIADPFAMVMHDIIVNSKSEAANDMYFLYRINLNALKEVNSDALPEEVKNGLIDFMQILSKATGDESMKRINEIKINSAFGVNAEVK